MSALLYRSHIRAQSSSAGRHKHYSEKRTKEHQYLQCTAKSRASRNVVQVSRENLQVPLEEIFK